MLTAATKRKIDTARDILVGKIPVPTSQVEQITLALIYKFMSDMDKRAKELGDSSGFFANGYEKYAWGKLMDKALPARDRVLLYREALEKMSLNPHIPQLFRDVFRDASLPFNDPETLKLFLDVIDQFEYDHSEELGNAFEYLLQVMGSQGDAGQFRTPRHIIDFIVEVVEPSKTDKILDPACGTAGFLISAYNHIKKNGLSSEEMTQLSENFVGYDISQDMQRLSLVNMYLHHFPNPHIYEYDTLTSEDRWNDDFDVILANPPFMTPKGGIRPHNRFSVPSKRAEVLFVDYIMEHLTARGKAGVIVPEGIIFQSQNAYKQLRKMMVEENHLWAVVSLPSGVFNPYSGVKTSILLFDREIAKKKDNILFVKISNDGFDLGAQRRPVEGSQIEEATRILRKYKQDTTITQDKLEEYAEDVVSRIELRGKDLETYEIVVFEPITPQLVKKSEIAKSGNYNLSGERYVEVNHKTKSEIVLVKLDSVTEINPKKSELTNLLDDTQVSFVPMSVVNENKPDFEPIEVKKFGEVKKGFTYFKNDDVLLAKITPCFENGKAGLANKLINGVGFGSTEFHVIRAISNKILPKYVYYLLCSKKFREIGQKNMTGSAGQKRVPTDFLKNFLIPLPPLSVQQEIVAELDRYQKIIDGAKQVVENYKPDFEVKEEWEWLELGDVCSLSTGTTPSTSNKEYYSGNNPFIKTGEIDNCIIDSAATYVSDDAIKDYSLKKLPKHTVLMAMYGQGKTRGKVALLEIPACTTQNAAAIQVKNVKQLLPKFLYYYFLGQYESLRKAGIDGHISHLNLKILSQVKIPLPTIQEQNNIVETLDSESEQIRSFKKMISSSEDKIKNKIESIWNGKVND